MEVREARLDDVPRMVELARLFFNETTLPRFMTMDESDTAGSFARMIESTDCGMFVMEGESHVVGMIGGIVSTHYFNLKHLSGQEFFWYVEPCHRGRRSALRLMTTLENWARSRGATSFVFAATNASNEKIARWYERRGYIKQETYYMGRL